MVERRERAIQFLKMLRQRSLRINKKRRAEFASERFDRDAFTKQLVADVMEIVHDGVSLESGVQNSIPQ